MTTANLRLPGAALILTVLAACSGGQSRPAIAPPPRVAVAQSEVDAAFDLLMAGQQDEAERLIGRLLKRDPMSATAQLLRDSIKRDPKDLLGPDSYAYNVRAGDTLVGLSQRFLGNRLKAYQLLRYNGLRAPAVLTPGQVLRIPGDAPRLEPVRRPDPVTPAPTPTPPTRPRPVAPKPTTVVPATNPAAARSARAAGLAALNAGNLKRAVGLLRRAAALDPGNPAIGRDLARAERIAATVRARR